MHALGGAGRRRLGGNSCALPPQAAVRRSQKCLKLEKLVTQLPFLNKPEVWHFRERPRAVSVLEHKKLAPSQLSALLTPALLPTTEPAHGIRTAQTSSACNCVPFGGSRFAADGIRSICLLGPPTHKDTLPLRKNSLPACACNVHLTSASCAAAHASMVLATPRSLLHLAPAWKYSTSQPNLTKGPG